MGDSKEIKDIDSFLKMKEAGIGFVVITDSYNPNRVHRPDCTWVSAEYFKTKVVDNGNALVHYYWVDSVESAEEKWNAHICTKCLSAVNINAV
ncbi:hypothetical protein [Paenibacillus thermotolerans]|uniref:hypothetical protein n=1 Tax=Paenibacillus thermotolerans TaxID=3027807 RepID=UPI002368EB07|nr:MULTISPECIES: hypothetical protein [unclassified Paenibacillus]